MQQSYDSGITLNGERERRHGNLIEICKVFQLFWQGSKPQYSLPVVEFENDFSLHTLMWSWSLPCIVGTVSLSVIFYLTQGIKFCTLDDAYIFRTSYDLMQKISDVYFEVIFLQIYSPL